MSLNILMIKYVNMQSSIEIAIIPDTNVFTYGKKRINDLSKLPFDEYYKILKTLELNDLTDEIKIFFPEIVLLELVHRLKMKLIGKYDELEKLNREFKNFDEIMIKYDGLDINDFCDNLKDKCFNELNIIPIPSAKEDLFNQILEMAIDKIPPFIEGDSDKGFKDAILFLSLLKFAENNKFDEYVVFSKDKGFINNIPELQDTFKKYIKTKCHNDFYNKLEIIKSNDIGSYINEKFELFKDLREYISNDFFYIVSDEYDYAASITLMWENYDIDYCELIEDDTHIHQLDENEFEVEIFLYIWYYSNESLNVFDRCETKDVIQSESYIFSKIDGEWRYDLDWRHYEIDFF